MKAYEGFLDVRLRPFVLPRERIDGTVSSLKRIYLGKLLEGSAF